MAGSGARGRKGTISMGRGRFSEAEWRVRVDLAALYRLLAHYGWTDLTYTHVAARLPDQPGRYLINPFGLLFEEITASSLVVIDDNGRVIAGDHPVNDAGHLIHTTILRARPEVNFSLHTHTRAGIAVSVMKCGLLPISQHACEALGSLSYHEYREITHEPDVECAALVRDLGGNYVMILHNHGLLSVGRTAGEAFACMYGLEMACQVQIDVLASGQAMTMPDPAQIEAQMAWGTPTDMPRGSLEWPALVRLLERVAPDYRS